MNGSANPNGASTTGLVPLQHDQPRHLQRQLRDARPGVGGTGSAPARTRSAYSYNTSTTGILLTPGTTYYFCAIASNSFGPSFGSVLSFTTPAAAPQRDDRRGDRPTATRPRSTASANPGGGDTTAWFRYSATYPGSCSDTFGTRVPATGGTDLGAGNTAASLQPALTGLAQGTIYYYCALGSNFAGTARWRAGELRDAEPADRHDQRPSR